MAFGKTAKDFFNDEIANQAIRDAFYLPETDAPAETNQDQIKPLIPKQPNNIWFLVIAGLILINQ